MKSLIKQFYATIILFVAFIFWTVLVAIIDVKAIGPNGSFVGLATINGWFHNLTGANMTLYVITDWLGLIPFAVAFGFAVFGIIQWIKRKKLSLVDKNLIYLGLFYILTAIVYILFEKVVINYRPVLIEGVLEASYPSSTTLLVASFMSTAIMQFNWRINNLKLKRALNIVLSIFIAFMIIGRLISGVHWLSDIMGGLLISSALVLFYYRLCSIKKKKVK